jgi:hypothetical protein
MGTYLNTNTAPDLARKGSEYIAAGGVLHTCGKHFICRRKQNARHITRSNPPEGAYERWICLIRYLNDFIYAGGFLHVVPVACHRQNLRWCTKSPGAVLSIKGTQSFRDSSRQKSKDSVSQIRRHFLHPRRACRKRLVVEPQRS